MSADPPQAPTIIDTKNGDQVILNGDGTASVTSSGGVEFVLKPDGQPKVAGITAFGVDDLADVERIETTTAGEVTTHKIVFRGGSVGAVSYINGVFSSYSGTDLGLNIRKFETKAYLKPGDRKTIS